MNHDRTYHPVPHVPAPRLRDADGSMRQAPRRSAGYAATHPVQPLKGLPGTRATDVSYRALAPGGADTGHRICTGTSESRLTAHYSLLTANSTYTFSAKEKDSETGLSYFGSRYYRSDLSVWLSVDPMSDKYPSLSPYTYCADNPVGLVDPNGEEIVITLSMDDNGNRIVNISFTATLVNKTSQNISVEEMKKYKNDITAGIKKTFGGSLDDGTRVNVDVDITVLDKDELPEPLTTRHEINIVDELVDMGHTAESIIGGGFMNIRLDVCRGELEDDPMDRSAAHEFGHLLGLDHVNDENNIMNDKTKGRVITGNQILEACGYFFNYDINRGIPHLEGRRKLRIKANTPRKHH